MGRVLQALQVISQMCLEGQRWLASKGADHEQHEISLGWITFGCNGEGVF
jgi:hypothetical protein